eukprot:9491017-Pyramimonas_sp.AAC.1
MGVGSSLRPVPVMKHQWEEERIELVVFLVGVVAALGCAGLAETFFAARARRARPLVGTRIQAAAMG